MSSNPRRRRLVLVTAAALIVLLVVVDLRRPPARQRSAQAAIAAIHFYQHRLSPALARVGARCRFTPTCSHYAEAVIRRHGLVSGGWMAAKRIARCGPWTRMGTHDAPR